MASLAKLRATRAILHVTSLFFSPRHSCDLSGCQAPSQPIPRHLSGSQGGHDKPRQTPGRHAAPPTRQTCCMHPGSHAACTLAAMLRCCTPTRQACCPSTGSWQPSPRRSCCMHPGNATRQTCCPSPVMLHAPWQCAPRQHAACTLAAMLLRCAAALRLGSHAACTLAALLRTSAACCCAAALRLGTPRSFRAALVAACRHACMRCRHRDADIDPDASTQAGRDTKHPPWLSLVPPPTLGLFFRVDCLF